MLNRLRREPSWVGGFYRRFTLHQISTLMGTLGLAFITLTAVFMIWNERRTLFEEGREHARQSAYFLSDHAQRLFEVSDIALRATQAAIADKDWDTVARSLEIAASMRSMDNMLPYVDQVWLADETGTVRQTTQAGVPPGYSISDRAVFQDARQPGDRLIIGAPIVGRISGKPTFLVARRIEDQQGRFRGIVAVSMDLAYFTNYWKRLDARNDERIAIVHANSGDILVQYPQSADGRATPELGQDLLAAAQVSLDAGSFDPSRHQFGFYHRIGELPAFVSVVFRDAVIDAQWRAWLWDFLPVAAVAFGSLAAIMLLGRRLGRRETRARREIDAARTLLSASNVRLEQRVAERTADLQETNREIQRFAYIVSHDLRAPLVNIMGFTSELESLRDELFAPTATDGVMARPAVERERLRADFDEAIGFIQSSIDKMDRLIKAILTLSRQGQRKFKPEPLDMDVVMRSISDGVAHRVQQAGVSVTIGPLPSIVADRIAVEQVFSNLVDNAVKYLKPGVPGQIEVTARETATTAAFEIRDNGRGIDAQDRERVFELFRRAGAQDQPGDGIGLANVRSLVRRLQGTITLDSTPGRGSTFTVVLPKIGHATEPGEDPN